MHQLAGHGAFARQYILTSLIVNKRRASAALALAALLLGTPAQAQTKGSPEHIRAVTGAIDSAAIVANAATSKDWPTYGLDYAESRFSKLSQITADNVKNIGLVWTYNLESTRGVEATPLVVDGIMYITAPWSVVHAVDVRSGKRIWSFDPGVDRAKGYRGCCDVVNRGVALYKGKCLSAPMTAGWSRSMPSPVRKSGRRTPSSTTTCPTPSPARRGCSTARS